MTGWAKGSHLAFGATAEISRGEPGEVVKSFHPDIARAVLTDEAEAATLACAAGVPTPRLITANVAVRQLHFEYAPGGTLDIATLRVGPRRTADALVTLLEAIGRTVRDPATPDRLPSVHARLLDQIDRGEAPPDLKASARADLEGLPTGDRLLHLDLHLRNVIWAKPPVVIDWSNASWGPPAADIARTRLLLRHSHFYVPGSVRPVVRSYLARVRALFEARLLSTMPEECDASHAWTRVLAAARFEGPVSEDEKSWILRSWEAGK